MIDLYTFGTPNGKKASIMLEEVELPYTTHVIDIREGQQFEPAYISINPNSKIPAIVDHDAPDGQPLTVFESGAIMIYLANKTHSPLLPTHFRERSTVIQWLMFQMAGFGPMCGQAHHFHHAASEKIPYAIDRYMNEVRRQYTVIDRHLADHRYFAGENCSIADLAMYPWVSRHEMHKIDLSDFSNVARWAEEVGARPAVQRGMAVPA